MCVCKSMSTCVCVGENAETEGEIKREVLGGQGPNEHWRNRGA